MPSIKERLPPSLRTPGFRRLLGLVAWLATIAYFGFALIFLLLRYAILPQIENYRGDLERVLSNALHRPVAIAKIEGGWQGLRPRLDLYDLRINDGSGRSALSLEHVEAVVGWTSLIYFRPRLYRLEIVTPELAVRRERDGHLFVAGLPVDTNADGGGFGDWLLDQHEIIVTDARVTWTDDMLGAPPLSMARLNLRIDNGFRHHRFGLTFEPPGEFASAVDMRGDLQGSNLDDLAAWHGDLYFQVNYADLAAWRTWVDYPVELPRGRGGLRVWLTFANRQPIALTADVALADTQVRLTKDLPMLDLQKIAGRIQGQRLKDGFSASVAHLALATREGLILQPADVLLRWQTSEGEFDASDLDLGVLNQLAGYLPLPREIRTPLTAYGPAGRLHGLRLGWNGTTDKPFARWRLNGRFDGLRLAAQGEVPGFSGISGEVAGDEKSGSFTLSGKDAALDLPAVFPEPRIALATIDFKAQWKHSGDAIEFKFDKATFHNQDAEGNASGSYSWRPGTKGTIDLDARLSRAEGNAVWRYMPHTVDKEAREWLHAAIVGGRSDETVLKLKGDLGHFPFADGSGIFNIKIKMRDATLRYAPDWPQISGIAGDLEFAGPRLSINAAKGNIMGVGIGPVVAEIPNLDPAEVINITGKANGRTTDFLKFIEASPVGDRINHFTSDMTATGNGELDLKLVMPLKHVVDTEISGGYRFDANRLVVDGGLPPFEEVRGRLEFTGSSLSARDVQARLLGGPMKVGVKTGADGLVAVAAVGDVSVVQLRQQIANPLFDHLAGSLHWSGTVKVREKKAEARIVSDLRGLSSSLPEPFNKTAGDSMPLLFEIKPPDLPRVAAKRGREPQAPVNRDQLEFTLGKAMRVKVLRRVEGGKTSMERGTIAIGDAAPKWPERGVIVAINMPRFDADLLRRVTNDAGDSGEGDVKGAASGINQLDLKASEAVVFGRLLHDVRITGARPGPTWNLDVKSREVVGKLDWFDGEVDKLSGRISQFSLPDAATGTNAPVEVLKELPNIDLVFDHVALRSLNLGEVKIAAENKGGYWNADIGVKNDDVTLNGQGTWRPNTDAPDTHFDFKLKARSVEKTLGRFGYINAVRRGNANMEGLLSWKGAPYDVNYATLNGTLKLDAHDGQFNKLEPGVGRLLGIISLQSLPRRITLDFSDIFSEGFAFDSIAAQATVTRGVIETRDMKIEGPAAKVQMVGKVDLNKETQDLKVRVQPALSQSVATGVLLANPAVGATTWLLNKLFGNPLDRAFAYDYAVTGGWADPKVEKLGAQPGAAIKKEATQ